MARRAPRILELREKNEVNCTWGLFSAFESCHGRSTRKVISNGRPVNANKHIIDCPRKLHQIASFDQECRRIQNETEQNIVKGQEKQEQEEHAKMDSELLDRLLKAQKRARRKKRDILNHDSPSTSTDISLNKLTLAAILEQNLQRKNNYQYKYSHPKASSINQPSDKIIILKPAPQNSKRTVNVSCHCSSLQSSHKSLDRTTSDGKSTSFSFRQVKQKLKHTFGVNNKLSHDKNGSLCKKQDPKKSNRGSDISGVTETVRKKLDYSSVGYSNKEELEFEFDVISEAKRHLSARLKNVNGFENVTRKKSTKTLGRILSSPEHGLISSPVRPKTEVSSCDYYNTYENTLQIINTETISPIRSTDVESHKIDTSVMDGERKIVLQPELDIPEVASELNGTNVVTIDTVELQKDDETIMQSISDSHSENEASTSTADSTKLVEEHRSPVSVLEPFFTEDSNSPPNITLQTARKKLQPLRLDFEECSFESSFEKSYIEEDQEYISEYVHSVLEASCLNWEHLSEIESPPEELLEPSIFEEVEFLHNDCYFDPKLLFDHMNEVLLHIYRCHFCPSPWLAFVKPRTRSEPLAETVLDEVMTEAEFYLLPRTEKRTLDQLVSKDVADCRSWLDVRFDKEQIVSELSEDLLEESILDILVEFRV
ncbi:hypothetical protein ACP275_01G078900 [Erythranthe tilingii]